MKTRNLFFLFFLAIGAGCSSSTNTNPNFSFTNADASYTGKVSGIYELAAYGTVGSWTGIDIKWKDSGNGSIQAMSSYGNAGKPILISFWATTPDTATWDEFALDSVQSVMGDSVGIVTVSESSFASTYKFDTLNKIGVQVVVDSAGLTELQYSQLEGGSIGQPQTFVLKPNGTIMGDYEGYVTASMFDSLVRAAYH